MAVCLNCGKEYDGCLCDECRNTADIEALCRKIIEYSVGSGDNPLWDRIAAELSSTGNFRNAVFALADELPSPRKEYWQILSFSGINANVQKNNRPWLYETYAGIKDADGLSRFELNRIKGLALGALYMDYRYEDADLLAGELLEEETLPMQAYCNLADFYSKTRRYDEADETMNSAAQIYGAEQAERFFGKIAENNRRYRGKEAAGEQQYTPKPEEARKSLINYLASIGIEAELLEASTSRSIIPEAIPRDQYPSPKEIRDVDFDTFVAYDLETTGLSPKTDAIIEIGAVKVSGGRVIESQEYVFREFVKPYKKKISDKVTQLTGITKEDVKDAREMWDVFRDFLEFAGDAVLVGFNNVIFDSRFLVRAGRYANIIMENPQFDVLKYAERFRDRLGLTDKKISLDVLSQKLDIKNPEAHRALPDAITTAQVFLKLKEMDRSVKPETVDDLLSDIDDW